jgi:hypothetical protein
MASDMLTQLASIVDLAVLTGSPAKDSHHLFNNCTEALALRRVIADITRTLLATEGLVEKTKATIKSSDTCAASTLGHAQLIVRTVYQLFIQEEMPKPLATYVEKMYRYLSMMNTLGLSQGHPTPEELQEFLDRHELVTISGMKKAAADKSPKKKLKQSS